MSWTLLLDWLWIVFHLQSAGWVRCWWWQFVFIITRSYAALLAADLDWIIGPGYSLGGYILGENHEKPTWNHEKPGITSCDKHAASTDLWNEKVLILTNAGPQLTFMTQNEKVPGINKNVTYLGSQLTFLDGGGGQGRNKQKPHVGRVTTDLLDV